MPEPRVITLGCRLNTLESEIIKTGALEAGLEDTVIVNTCAVTAEAERQARQTVRRLKRENPNARIIVTGCAAQLKPETFASMTEVDTVIGNAEKLNPANLSPDLSSATSVSDIMTPAAIDDAYDPPIISGFEERTRAFVQIQQGCDHRCTFCIIPFVRGPNRSVDPEQIIVQANTMVENGHVEVVLTGVDISSYGSENTGMPGLGTLVRRILDRTPGLKRLRLSSLDPAAIDDEIFRLLQDEPRFMPHLHLSLQSGDDTILKRMKRRHRMTDVEKLILRARESRPDVVFGADLIAGFPTETDDMFNHSLEAVRSLNLTHLHTFPYSTRPGTPAARMPALSGDVVRERARQLRLAGDDVRQQYMHSRIGNRLEVLIEQGRDGHCRHFSPVRLTVDAGAGSIVEARAISFDKDHGRLIAEPVVKD